MGERITVVGGSESAIAVTLDGTQAMKLANQFSTDLHDYYANNNLNFMGVTESPDVNDQIGYGVITQSGAYSAGNGYDYIVAGGKNYTQNPLDPNFAVNALTADLLTADIKINSVMSKGQKVNVLAGNLGSFTYVAGEEDGVFAGGNAGNNIIFQGNTVSGGDWSINTGKGDDQITTGSGDNTVNASTGNNKIDVTAGKRNTVNSEGNDTIFASTDSAAQNRVTINGGSSVDDHASVSINSGAAVTDLGLYNTVTVGGGSTIEGSYYGNYTFDGSYSSAQGTITNATESTITASSDLMVVHGDSNTISASQDVSVLNAVGNTEATVGGTAIGFGADGLNYTLDATSADKSGLFVADVGNETLNASGSTSALQLYANTVAGGGTTFVATGGSGNDTLIAGTGDSTFTGGAGDNLFLFNKVSSDNGDTVITDFSKEGTNNQIGLFNYGLNSDSLQALLNSSTNDANGDAVLKLDGHTITVQGVSVSDLNVNQFAVYNDATTTKS